MTAGLGKGYAAGVRIGWDPIAAEKPWSIDPRAWRVVHLYGGIGVGNGFGFGASIGNGQVPQGPWGGMIAGGPLAFPFQGSFGASGSGLGLSGGVGLWGSPSGSFWMGMGYIL